MVRLGSRAQGGEQLSSWKKGFGKAFGGTCFPISGGWRKSGRDRGEGGSSPMISENAKQFRRIAEILAYPLSDV